METGNILKYEKDNFAISGSPESGYILKMKNFTNKIKLFKGSLEEIVKFKNKKSSIKTLKNFIPGPVFYEALVNKTEVNLEEMYKFLREYFNHTRATA